MWAEVAIFFKINTKQMNKVWAEYQFLNFKLAGARKQ